LQDYGQAGALCGEFASPPGSLVRQRSLCAGVSQSGDVEADLFESIVNRVVKAEWQGLLTVDEIQNAVDVESFRLRFTHDDKALNAKFRRYVNRMIENASAEKRDGRKSTY
jgi:hypothetical protein